MLIRLAVIYLVGGALGFLLFCLGFGLGLFSGDHIIFYRGLKILALTSLLHWALLALWIGFGLHARISMAHAFAAAMASLALCATFLIVIPVSLDRSVSVFLLGYMSNQQRPMTKQELEDILIDKYVKEYGAIDRRTAEQIVSGNIEQDPDGRFVLTSHGQAFISVARRLAGVFGVDMKFLDPK